MMKTKTATAALAIIALTALSACTTDPTPNPTTPGNSTTTATASPTPAATTVGPPAPTKATPPASEQEAIASASTAAVAFVRMSNLIEEEGGVNADRLDAFAVGASLDAAKAQANLFVTQKAKRLGDYVVRVDPSMSSARESLGPTGTKTPFGEASLNVCWDPTMSKTQKADGSVTPDQRLKGIVTMTVVYNPADQTWKVGEHLESRVSC